MGKQPEEGVLEAMRRFHRVDVHAGVYESGDEFPARRTVELDHEPIRLRLHRTDPPVSCEDLLGAPDVIYAEMHRPARSGELGDRPRRDETTVIHDHDVAADLLYLGQQMAGEQHCRPVRREAQEQLSDLADLAWIETVSSARRAP